MLFILYIRAFSVTTIFEFIVAKSVAIVAGHFLTLLPLLPEIQHFVAGNPLLCFRLFIRSITQPFCKFSNITLPNFIRMHRIAPVIDIVFYDPFHVRITVILVVYIVQ